MTVSPTPAPPSPLRRWASGWAQKAVNPATVGPDISRGIRTTVSFLPPFLVGVAGWEPMLPMALAALAAQNIANCDIRGAYPLRFSFLLAMTAVLTASAGVGGIASGNVFGAVAAGALIAVLGGLWRHLSSDYGMALSIASALVFLLTQAAPASEATVASFALWTLIGGLWGIAIQIASWPIRAEHPIRRLVSDSWEAAATLFDRLLAPGDSAGRHQGIVEQESELRTVLDAAYAALKASKPRPLIGRLDAVNTSAANMVLAVVSFNTALEALMDEPDTRSLVASFEPALIALRNLCRTVALAVVSQQPAHVATFDVRLRRIDSLLTTVEARLAARPDPSPVSARLSEALELIRKYLHQTEDSLKSVVARSGERTAFSMELFDLHTWTLRPLASSVNLSWRFDPAILRFALRAAVLFGGGVALSHLFSATATKWPLDLYWPRISQPGWPVFAHAYWLPFTMVVVLQPDFGATRLRASQRMGGTVVGGLLAGAILWLRAPEWVIILSIALTCFGFGYVLRRHYGIAVVFITLFVVLLTEGTGPRALLLTRERLEMTLAGGFLALGAAFVFWPVWEKARFGGILAAAFRANGRYLQFLVDRMHQGPAHPGSVSRVKQAAESANSAAFSSLRRMFSDPKNQQDGVEQAAALTNGLQRLTRLFNLFTVHLDPVLTLDDPELDRFVALALESLETLAGAVEGKAGALEALPALRGRLDRTSFATVPRSQPATDAETYQIWVHVHLTRAAIELSALTHTVGQGAGAFFSGEALPSRGPTPAPG